MALLGTNVARGATLLSGFSETTINGPTGGGWSEAVGISFDETGRTYVWERQGRVWIREYGATSWSSLIDIAEEVGGWRDFGLLGFTLDPNFLQNGHIYLLYVVDRHHLMNHGTGSYHSMTNEYYRATIGRITRYTARSSDNFRTVDLASRRVLLGETKETGIPILHESHGVGSLAFGTDGTLLASAGDGASYASTDVGSASGTYYVQALTNGIIKPKENIGAYRSQLVDSHNGKILRLDPATGDGIPSNPFYDSANTRSARSRVWALGLRNPSRFAFKPGTGSHNRNDADPGTLLIGDVGWNVREDLHVCDAPGQNFGWPAFEGLNVHSGYNNSNVQNQDAANPLYPASGCTQYFYFRDLIKQDTQIAANKPPFNNPCNTSQKIPSSIPQFLHTRPVIDWRHGTAEARVPLFLANGNATQSTLGTADCPVTGPSFAGNCAIGGTWYSGTDFPAQYQNTFFSADYGAQWIKNFVFDANDKLLEVRGFATNAGGVVAVATHPLDGGLYYISWTSTLRRIAYSSGNLPPKAVASVISNYGPGPLIVQFTGSGCTDPESQPLTYQWNFGDGTATSTASNPSHTFNASPGVPTKYTVTLTVRDSAAQTDSTTLIISVNNTPPNVAITSPANGAKYPMTGDTIYNLTADVSDAEFNNSQLQYAWQTILRHNNHEHPEPIDSNHTTTTLISPVGCDGNTYYYRIVLQVTDPAGLSTEREVRLYPDCPAQPVPVIGNTADGPSSDNIWANGAWINAGRFQAVSNMMVTTMHAKVASITGKYKCAIYTDSSGQPNRFLRSTVEVSNPGTGWQDFLLTSSLMLTNGQFYWLAIWSDDTNARVYYSDAGGTLRWVQQNYGNWPDPFSAADVGNYNYCIYASGFATTTLLSIAVAPENPTLPVGATQPFTATATYSDATTHDITSQAAWASSDAVVATINAGGLANGVSVGTTTIAASMSGVSGDTALAILKSNATVTLGSLNPIYDASPHHATATTAPAGLTVNFTYDEGPSAPITVGSYEVIGTINDPNFKGGATNTLTIGARALSVTANNASRVFGQTNPVFGGVITGVQSGDAISATYTTAAVTESPVGTYDIVPALVDPGNRLGNYSVTTTSGALTIVDEPRLLSFSESPEGTFTALWLVHPGRTYRFQYKEKLSEGNWTTLGADYTAASASISMNESMGTNRHRFYRVLDITPP